MCCHRGYFKVYYISLFSTHFLLVIAVRKVAVLKNVYYLGLRRGSLDPVTRYENNQDRCVSVLEKGGYWKDHGGGERERR